MDGVRPIKDDERRDLLALIETGDRYGLMLAVVRGWAAKYHPQALRAAVYVIEDDDAEPTRVRVPFSASS